MTALLAFAPGTPAARVRDVEPREWARRGVLSSLGGVQREVDAGEARKLRLVTEWADLHRADAVSEQTDSDGVLHPASVYAFSSEPVVMSGVPVDEFCLAELATALRLSHGTARGLTEDALELRERLPRLWVKVHAGTCPVWKARLVAQKTRSLSDAAADFVDRQLAPFAATLGAGRIKTAVDAAILRFDPDRAAAEAAEASDNRGVWFDLEHGGDDLVLDDSRPNGVGRLEAVASTPDLLAFRDALKAKAIELEILGDHSPEQVRMSKSIGILADPQHALDLSATADAALEAEADAEGEQPRHRRPNRRRPTFGGDRPIHIHLHTSTQVARVQASGLPHAASPVAQEAIDQWIRDLAPGVQVKVTPVVDLNRHYAVDQYEAPDHLRAMVEERDHVCVFPYCTNRGRFDLDHIDPYLDPDDGGPPAQTSNANLAKLCRYHHRAKTHTAWTYKRVDSVFDLDPAGPDPWMPDWLDAQVRDLDTGGPPDAHLWTSPLGFTYFVTATGTYPRD